MSLQHAVRMTATLVLLAALVAACQTSRIDPTASGDPVAELRFQASGGWGISPFSANGSPNPVGTSMMTFMFDTLTWRDANGPIPWLNVPSDEGDEGDGAAEGSRRTAAGGRVSADGLQYRYQLRPGVRWHDGQPLTAQDVVFTFEYMKARKAGGFSIGFPPPGGPQSRFIDYLASVRVDPDDASGQTVLFTLHDATAHPCASGDESCLLGPWVPFEDLVLGAVPVIPRHVWGPEATTNCHEKGGPGNTCVSDPVNNPPDRQYLGSGPYVLDTSTFDPSTLVAQFNANTDYFRGLPHVRKISFVPVGEGQNLNALKTGLIDGSSVGGGSGITADTLGSFEGFVPVRGGLADDRSILFNLTRGFPFDRKEFRQAIAYGIDRLALVKAFVGGRGAPGSSGGLSPSSPELAPDLPSYDLDLARANGLLDSIGVVDSDGDGLRNLPGEGCGFLPSCPEGKGGTKLWSDSSSQRLTEVVVESLRKDLRLDIAAFSPDPPLFTFGDYSMGLFAGQNLPGEPDQLRTRFSDRITSQSFPGKCDTPFGCHKNPPVMVFGYANPEFMDLADQQAVDANPVSRLEKLHRMQHLIAEDVPAVSLYAAERLFIHRPATVPFYFTPGGVGADPQGGTTLNKHVFVTGQRTG